MKVKDLIWKLQQIYDKEKQVVLTTFDDTIADSLRENEKVIDSITEKEFAVYIQY
uniref:Uncharacterized protein n=1 Tax=viral metagenome TaxID=1070528 RepID=A0A6M3X6L8_9ZZZZ